MRILRIILSITFIFIATKFLGQNDSTHITLNGQITSWAVGKLENPYNIQFGGRFVPALLGNFSISPATNLDFEVSANINGSINLTGLQYETVNGQLKPYRIWARYSGSNWEVRAGLQKINFGQAKMFRPLMWFDGMDVRDPLQLTDGVYGVLGKYFFESNANIWLWSLMGTGNRKGWEFNATQKNTPEIGGRAQLPVFNGELAMTTNYRKVHAINVVSSKWDDHRLLNETRLGLDGKWDIGAGIWFENSSVFTQANEIFVPRFQNILNIGADYTMPIGNGLGVTLEYLNFYIGDGFYIGGINMNLIGTMFTYPLSIMDNVSAMVFYLPGTNVFMNYMSWARTYDNWSIYAIGFLNPSTAVLLPSQSNSSNLFSGKGVQLMVSYNF